MDRVERLTNLILALLHASKPMTLQEIAEMMVGAYPESREARRQAFERDKRLLRDEGIEITVTQFGASEGGQPLVGYHIRPDDYYLPDLDLEPDEQLALNLAVAAVPIEGARGREAVWKLGGTVEDGTMQDNAPPLAALPALPALSVLHDAVRLRRAVRFDYRASGPRPASGSARHLEPYGTIFRNGFWYVVGRDVDRGEQRVFRIDRIEGSVQASGPDAFERPEHFDPRAAVPEGWRAGGEDEVAATVLVEASHAAKVVGELGAGAVRERRGDGSVVVSMDVTNPAGFRSWLLGLTTHAEVLGPPSLRADIVDWLRAVAGGRSA